MRKRLLLLCTVACCALLPSAFAGIAEQVINMGPGTNLGTGGVLQFFVTTESRVTISAFSAPGLGCAPVVPNTAFRCDGVYNATLSIPNTGLPFPSTISMQATGPYVQGTNPSSNVVLTVNCAIEYVEMFCAVTLPRGLYTVNHSYSNRITPGNNGNALARRDSWTVRISGDAVVAVPTLDSISPAGGTRATTVSVSLTGTNFIAGATVQTSNPGISVSNVNVVSPTRITADFGIGADAAFGPAEVTVGSPAGTSNARSFQVVPPPALSSILPAQGIVGASVPVTLFGSGFSAGDAVAVAGSGISVRNVAVVSSSQITAVFDVPANAVPGAYPVTVSGFGGVSGSIPFAIVRCQIAVAPEQISVPARGATGQLTVSAPAGCAWSAQSSASWVVLNEGLSGQGNGAISYQIAENAGPNSRQATLTIANASVVFTQAALNCTPQLNPPSILFGPNGGEATVEVTAGCPWTAQSQSAFLTVSNGSGNGNGTFSYTVAAYKGGLEPRTGIINVNGVLFTVTQNATRSGLGLITLTPCRMIDTRSGAVRLVPAPTGGFVQEFAMRGCQVPPSAEAYSLNITAVPSGPLAFLTVWPCGTAQPLASTLNSPSARVVANAALVPSGTNGSVCIFASDPTDVIIDINGYFVP